MADGMIHIAGLPVVLHGGLLRQRCAWCGAQIIDQDLSRVAVPEADADRPYPTWEIGALVFHGDGVTHTVEHHVGGQLPAGCCAALDPAATA